MVRAKPKSQFNVKRIGKHLMDMIPALKLPTNFELKRKPSYLKKYRRRKGPNWLENNNVKSMEEEKYQTIPCTVRLVNCDAMIDNILRSQEIQNAPNDVEQNEKLEPVEMNDDIESDHEEHLKRVLDHMNQYDMVINLSSNYGSENSLLCFDVSSESGDGVIEAKTIDEQSPSDVTNTNATPTHDMNDGTVKISGDKTPDNETSMVDEELMCRKDPAPRTYERNNRPKAISGEDCMISANTHQTIVARKSYGSLHSPNRAMRNENMANVSPKMDVTVENDEPIIDFDSDLTRIHSSRHEQNDIVQSFCEVLDDSGLFSDVRSEPLLQTQSDFEPESPNYTELEDNDDANSEEITDQNSEDTHIEGSESELGPVSNTEFQAVQSNASNDEDSNEVLNSENDNKQENENVDPLAIAESDTNEQNNDYSPIIDREDDAEEDKILDEAENNEVPENPSDTLDELAKENVIAIESIENSLPSPSESLESVKNEISTIFLDENSSTQPIDDKLKLLQEDNAAKENLIQLLKAELMEKNAKLLEKERRINDLESQVVQLKEIKLQLAQLKDVESKLNGEMNTLKINHDTQIQTIIDAHLEQTRLNQTRSEQEILLLKADHDQELEKTIEETKNRKWCTLCKKEAKIIKFNPPTCSTVCLQRLW